MLLTPAAPSYDDASVNNRQATLNNNRKRSENPHLLLWYCHLQHRQKSGATAAILEFVQCMSKRLPMLKLDIVQYLSLTGGLTASIASMDGPKNKITFLQSKQRNRHLRAISATHNKE
ncbi:MAG: hypothetical protein ACREBR_02470 [bacterium]